MLPNPQGCRQLIPGSRRQRVTDVALYRRDRPFRHAKRLGHFAQQRRLGDPVLGRTGAMGLNHTPVTESLIAQDPSHRRNALGDGQIIARTWTRYGFFCAVGSHADAGGARKNGCT